MSIEIVEPIFNYRKFLEWFGNVRDYVLLDLENITDEINMGKDSPFPFTSDELEIWQKCGLITVRPMFVSDHDFKPYQRIDVHYKNRCSLSLT